jgi:hypothetical protein
MQREWTDQRDGKAYRVEVEPCQSGQEPGKPLEVMSEDPWRVWFHSDEAPNLDVASDVGPRLPVLPDRDIQRMLDEARGWATVDVDEELVTFYVHPVHRPMETPPDSEPTKTPQPLLVLSGRGERSASVLAQPSPKDRIEEYDVDELRALWRKWVS